MMGIVGGEGLGSCRVREAAEAPAGHSRTYTPDQGVAEGLNLTAVPICKGCSRPITNRILHKIGGFYWHGACLKCSRCQTFLNERCYVKDNDVLCEQDFYKAHGVKCAGCQIGLPPSALAMRAHQSVFHVECFRCNVCDRKLDTGNELFLKHDIRPVCSNCYREAKQRNDESKIKINLGALAQPSGNTEKVSFPSSKNVSSPERRLVNREAVGQGNALNRWPQHGQNGHISEGRYAQSHTENNSPGPVVPSCFEQSRFTIQEPDTVHRPSCRLQETAAVREQVTSAACERTRPLRSCRKTRPFVIKDKPTAIVHHRPNK